MKFGVQFRPQAPPDGARIVERWEEVVEAAVIAEESGFDGVFLPEHHMMPDGYPPSPWAGLGAIAGRTERVDLGTGVYLLPLRHPLQAAEDAAMLDVVSNGRLRFGVGLGNYAPEYEMYGWDKRQQVSRLEEAIDVVRRAWAGEELDHVGRHFTAKGRMSPLPVSAQLWLGATTEAGVRRAARLGLPWIMSPLQRREGVAALNDVYRAAGREAGTEDRLGLVLMRDGFVADSLADVERLWWPALRAEHWTYFAKLPRFTGERSGPTFAGVGGPEDMDFDRHRDDRLVAGSPEECIATISRFRETLEVDYLVMTFRVSRGPDFEHEVEAIRRFGAEVIPAFRNQEAVTA